MSNAVIVDVHYKDYHRNRMTTRFVDALQEIHVEKELPMMSKSCGRELICDVRRTGINQSQAKQESKAKVFKTKRMTLTKNLYELT